MTLPILTLPLPAYQLKQDISENGMGMFRYSVVYVLDNSSNRWMSDVDKTEIDAFRLLLPSRQFIFFVITEDETEQQLMFSMIVVYLYLFFYRPNKNSITTIFQTSSLLTLKSRTFHVF